MKDEYFIIKYLKFIILGNFWDIIHNAPQTDLI